MSAQKYICAIWEFVYIFFLMGDYDDNVRYDTAWTIQPFPYNQFPISMNGAQK